MAFAAHEPPNHCTSAEQIVFSCTIGKKILSVCASNILSKQAGYMQYRFGQKNKIEMSYPETPQHPRQFIFFSSVPYAGGGEAHLRFANGQYEYIVYDRTTKGEWGKAGHRPTFFSAGVVIRKDKKIISNLKCRPEDHASIRAVAYEIMDQEEFEDLHLP